MELNRIKNMCGTLSAIVLLGSTLCTSYVSEDISRNPLLPTKEDEKMDGVIYGAYLPNLEKSVIPIGTVSGSTEPVNRYQIGVNLAGDTWVGYMSPRDNRFNGSKNLTNYSMYENWVNYVYSFMATDIYSPWMQIRRISQDERTRNDEIYALAQIIKTAALHRITDMSGPIPCSQMGKGSFKVAYDSQESVYRSLLKELEEAIQTLDDYPNKNKEVLPTFDTVYNGDANKWMRFANSLMLRLAIRVHSADAELAKEYAEEAVKYLADMIDSKELAAQMGKGAGLQMKNLLKMINEEYNDTRMGVIIYSYLAECNDARVSVYFVNNNGFKTVRHGIAKSGDAYNGFTRPNVHEDDPLYWTKASEVCFLKAEGTLTGFDMDGSTGDLYNAGIRMPFSEDGLDNSSAEDYLRDYIRKPANYTDVVNGELSVNVPSSITIHWENRATEEARLERIIIQKYFAIFPNGQEAWIEWRRTGYPRQIVVAKNKASSAASVGNGYDVGGVRRMSYLRAEHEQNSENLHNAINQHLGGVDNAAAKVWWDKKSGQ